MEIDFTARCGLLIFLIRNMNSELSIVKLGLGVERVLSCVRNFKEGKKNNTGTPK